VHIFSHREDGTITGFDAAINIQNSDNVKVKQVIATGPVGIPGVQRPRTVGIMIQGVDCGGGNVRIGGGTKTGNDVSNHTRGIQLDNSSCVYIGYNEVHDNRAEFAPLHIPEDLGGGIGVFNSPDNHIRSNVVFDNGDNNPLEGGIGLIFEATTGNLVVENQANENRGNGIETIGGASNNYIVNNEMLRNDHFDAFSDAGSMNRWNENNRCVTQTVPPPDEVCGPDEA
jgi:hypothetical protein